MDFYESFTSIFVGPDFKIENHYSPHILFSFIINFWIVSL